MTHVLHFVPNGKCGLDLLSQASFIGALSFNTSPYRRERLIEVGHAWRRDLSWKYLFRRSCICGAFFRRGNRSFLVAREAESEYNRLGGWIEDCCTNESGGHGELENLVSSKRPEWNVQKARRRGSKERLEWVTVLPGLGFTETPRLTTLAPHLVSEGPKPCTNSA